MNQLLAVLEDKIVIEKLRLNLTEGSITHVGTLNVRGDVSLHSSLDVVGTLTADTINVKNLVYETVAESGSGHWTANTEDDLQGKGFSWTWGSGSTNLFYRDGGRLWTDANID